VAGGGPRAGQPGAGSRVAGVCWTYAGAPGTGAGGSPSIQTRTPPPAPSVTPRSVPRAAVVASEHATAPSAGQPGAMSPEPVTRCTRIAGPPGTGGPWNAISAPPPPSGIVATRHSNNVL